MNLQTNNPGRRWWLALLAGLIVVLIAAFVVYQFAIRKIEEKIVNALGPLGEVKELHVGLTRIEMTGLRIRAPLPEGKEAAWPAEDEFRAEHIVVVPSIPDLLRSQIVLNSIRVEGAYFSVLRARDGNVKVLPSRQKTTPPPGESKRLDGATAQAPATATIENDPASSPPARSVTINSIEVINGAVEFFDATLRKTPIKQRLEQINARIGKISIPDLTGQSTIQLEAIHKGVRQDGKISIDGSIELSTRESGITTVLRDVDMVSLQPYLVKAGEAGVNKGALDFELNSSIKKGMLYAPGTLSLSDLELSSPSGTIMGLPRKAAVSMLKNKKGKITVNFVLTGDINDPNFSLNENLSTRIATSIAGKLGVNIEGLAKGIGETSGGTAASIGKALDRLKKR